MYQGVFTEVGGWELLLLYSRYRSEKALEPYAEWYKGI